MRLEGSGLCVTYRASLGMNTSKDLICNPPPVNLIHGTITFSQKSSSEQKHLLSAWYCRLPSTGHSCSDSSNTLPTWFLVVSIFKSFTLFCFMFSARQSSTPIGPALGSPAWKRFLRPTPQSVSSDISLILRSVTSCLIRSATVVFSFPFWPNSGQ